MDSVTPTNTQLGQAVGQLNQRLQLLESTPTASTTTSTTTPQGAWTEVGPVSILSSGASTSWTTIDLSPYIKSGATRVALSGYCSGNTGELDIRAGAGRVSRVVAKPNGNAHAFYIEAGVVNRSIQYQVTGTITTLQVNLIEFYS